MAKGNGIGLENISMKNENVRKSELTREKQRLLWEVACMDIETVLHDVNTILLKCGEKDMQEYFIKRYLGSDSITVLEETMKKYGIKVAQIDVLLTFRQCT